VRRRSISIAISLGLGAGACSKAPQEAAGPSNAGARSDSMTASKSGSSGPPSKQRPPSASAPAPPRSTVTFPEAASGADALPRVTSIDELAARDGAEVRLVGTYVERDVRMKQAPPAVHHGHVAIQLADGKLVSLLPPWDDDARRPVAEVERFAGRQVEVVGTASRRGVADPDGGASLMGPTIDEVRALRLAP
jgi:hypothetical protein